MSTSPETIVTMLERERDHLKARAEAAPKGSMQRYTLEDQLRQHEAQLARAKTSMQAGAIRK